MPHFSADLLDALLDGDPAELEALRALLGGEPAAPVAKARSRDKAPAWEPRPGRCADCRPAPPFSPASLRESPAKPRAGLQALKTRQVRKTRPEIPPEARDTGRRPGLPAVRARGGGRGRPARHRSGP